MRQTPTHLFALTFLFLFCITGALLINRRAPASVPVVMLENSPASENAGAAFENPPVSSVPEGASTARIEFSHGPARNGAVNEGVRKVQEEVFDRYHAAAFDEADGRKCLYLTFDCGYEYAGRTEAVLDILRRKQIPAAFFLVLDFAEAEPELTRRMLDEGHVIGNHSCGHADYTTLRDEEIVEDVTAFEEYMQKHFRFRPECFRFPSGVYSEHSLALIDSMGYRTFFWSCAYADWDREKGPGAEAALTILKDRLHPGAVLLLHPVSSDCTELLPLLIDYALGEGYTFESLLRFGSTEYELP